MSHEKVSLATFGGADPALLVVADVLGHMLFVLRSILQCDAGFSHHNLLVLLRLHGILLDSRRILHILVEEVRGRIGGEITLGEFLGNGVRGDTKHPLVVVEDIAGEQLVVLQGSGVVSQTII